MNNNNNNHVYVSTISQQQQIDIYKFYTSRIFQGVGVKNQSFHTWIYMIKDILKREKLQGNEQEQYYLSKMFWCLDVSVEYFIW